MKPIRAKLTSYEIKNITIESLQKIFLKLLEISSSEMNGIEKRIENALK